MTDPSDRRADESERAPGRVEASVAIQAPPDCVFHMACDIEAMRRCFPRLVFEPANSGTLVPGTTYRVRRRGLVSWWLRYTVSEVDSGCRVAGELSGRDPVFAWLRFDHRVRPENGGTLSHETWAYRLRFGVLGALLDRALVRRWLRRELKTAQDALKAEAERVERHPF